MTNQQLYLAIGIPALLLLSNTALMLYLFARVDKRIDDLRGELRGEMRDLRSEMRAGFDRVDAEIKAIREDLTRFYGEQRAHDERLNALERQRPSQS